MRKYYSVMIYWREAGPEMDFWSGEKESWVVPARNEEVAFQRALEINDFTVRHYAEDEWDYEIDGYEILWECDGENDLETDWTWYQNALITKFRCVDCGRTEYLPKENEIGKFCIDCWALQKAMKSLG